MRHRRASDRERLGRRHENAPRPRLGREGVAAPRLRQPEPEVVGLGLRFEIGAGQPIAGDRLTLARLLPPRRDEGVGGPVPDPGRGHRGHQRRDRPGGGPQAPRESSHHLRRRQHVGDAQAGRQRLRRAREVVRPLRRQRRDRAGALARQQPVNVVLHDREAVGAGDGRDLAAALLGHHRGRRVVQGGDQVEGLRAALAAGRLERLGPEALRVHRQPLQPQVQQARDRLQPRVGQRLRQQEVARLELRGQDDGQAVLAAGADEHVLGRRLHPGPLDPGSPGLAIGRVSPGGRVVEQPPRVGARGEGGERSEQRGPLRVPGRVRRVVLAEVHGPVAVSGIGGRLAPAPDECPASHLARDQPLARGFRVRPAHRSHGDAESIGQLAVGGQAAARPQRPGRHVLGESLDDGPVPRALPAFQPRLPDCHGVNIAIDTLSFQL